MKRILLVTVVFVMVVLQLVGCTTAATQVATEAATQPPAVATEAPAAQPVAMDFVVWSYGIETINDNIKNFQTMYPNITITLKDYSWLDYHDTMVAAFAANNPPYLLYGSDHWLNEWAAAGWLAPLDKYCPNVAGYSKEVAAYASTGMTYNGAVYGLSYYADDLDFMYNDTLLKQGGFTAAPATLDEIVYSGQGIEGQGRKRVSDPLCLVSEGRRFP